MCAKSSDNADSADRGLDAVRRRLADARWVLAVTHERPDGDGLGCLVALARAARAAGKTASMLCPDAVPIRYQFLFTEEKPAYAERFAALSEQADAIVLLDVGAFAQLRALEGPLRRCRGKLLVLDHHATGDDLADVRWVDPSGAAAGVMLLELLEALGWPIDAPAAEALLTALVSDTGWLAFANTDARCLQAVARLLDKGPRMDRLYRRLCQSDSPQRLRLMARMLEGLELHCSGRLAAMTIRLGDFTQTGADPSETENLVNEALRIGSVEAAILLIENDNFIRVSLRSRETLDVAKVAQRFGGGGHVRAAGIRATGDLESLKRQVIDACAQALRKK